MVDCVHSGFFGFKDNLLYDRRFLLVGYLYKEDVVSRECEVRRKIIRFSKILSTLVNNFFDVCEALKRYLCSGFI